MSFEKYQQYVTPQRAARYAQRAERYLYAPKIEIIDTRPVDGWGDWLIQKFSNGKNHCKNIYSHFNNEAPSAKTELETLAALKQVLKGKLKHLANDPRPFDSIANEIITTEQELYALNHDILKEIVGEQALQKIKESLSVALDENNKLKISFQYEQENRDITNLINSRDYIHDNILKENVELDKLSDTILLQILTALFFNDKNVSVSTRLRQLRVQQYRKGILEQETQLEIAQRTIALNTTNGRYLISRIGKFIAWNYALSQVTSLAFMCVVMLIATYALLPATVPFWVPLVFYGSGGLLIAWWVQGTGRQNWYGCRDNIPNMLIDFWNIIINKNDVNYTLSQNVKVFFAFLECAICGFVSGFFTHYITLLGLSALFGTTSAIVVFAPIITIPLALLAAANMFLYMYKYTRESALSGSVFKDAYLFLCVTFESNQNEILKLIAHIKLKYRQRFLHVYSGEKLEEKLNNKFDNSILGIILNYNLKAVSASGNSKFKTTFIYTRALFMLFVAVPCVALVIMGIIYGQLANFHALANLLDGFMKMSESVAQSISKLLCFFAGTAYLSPFTYATVKCGADLAYSVPKTAGGESSKLDFQQVRLANCMDNGAQTAFGFTESKRVEEENGELQPWEDAMGDVCANTAELATFTLFTGSAALASFAFASAPGVDFGFDKKLHTASKKYTLAYENSRRIKPACVDIPYKDGTNKHTVEIFVAKTDGLKNTVEKYQNDLNQLITDLEIKFTKITAQPYKNSEECIHLHIKNEKYDITLQTTAYFKKKIFKDGKEDRQPYVDATQIIEILGEYKMAKETKNEAAIHDFAQKWHNESNGIKITANYQTESEYTKNIQMAV